MIEATPTESQTENFTDIYEVEVVEGNSLRENAEAWLKQDIKDYVERFSLEEDEEKEVSELLNEFMDSFLDRLDLETEDFDEAQLKRSHFQDSVYRAEVYARGFKKEKTKDFPEGTIINARDVLDSDEVNMRDMSLSQLDSLAGVFRESNPKDKLKHIDTTLLGEDEWIVNYSYSKGSAKSNLTSDLLFNLGISFLKMHNKKPSMLEDLFVNPTETIKEYDNKILKLLDEEGSGASIEAKTAYLEALVAHWAWQVEKTKAGKYGKIAQSDDAYMLGSFEDLYLDAQKTQAKKDNLMKDFGPLRAGLLFEHHNNSLKNKS